MVLAEDWGELIQCILHSLEKLLEQQKNLFKP